MKSDVSWKVEKEMKRVRDLLQKIRSNSDKKISIQKPKRSRASTKNTNSKAVIKL